MASVTAQCSAICAILDTKCFHYGHRTIGVFSAELHDDEVAFGNDPQELRFLAHPLRCNHIDVVEDGCAAGRDARHVLDVVLANDLDHQVLVAGFNSMEELLHELLVGFSIDWLGSIGREADKQQQNGEGTIS